MILSHLNGNRRVYICGRRLHHGRVGLLLAAAGVALMLDDFPDFPWRMTHRRFGG